LFHQRVQPPTLHLTPVLTSRLAAGEGPLPNSLIAFELSLRFPLRAAHSTNRHRVGCSQCARELLLTPVARS
jgi:hypothetical protein